MNSISRICNSEKRFDGCRKLYKSCDSCNAGRVFRNCYNNRDKILEKKKDDYYKNKEYLHEYNEKKERANYLILKIKIKTKAEMIETTDSVS